VKLSVMQENLARGLSVVSRAVSTRSTLPVLANVLLRTEDAGLKLTATNLEIGITYWVPGKIESDGATTVPAKLLTDLVNSLQGGDRVDLELGPNETLHLRCGRFESHLKGIDAEEFPAIQATGERPTTRIAQNVLRRALEQVAFAAATDEARPILTGVLCRFEGDMLTLAAADNYRIAVKTIQILDAVEETSIVVPSPSTAASTWPTWSPTSALALTVMPASPSAPIWSFTMLADSWAMRAAGRTARRSSSRSRIALVVWLAGSTDW
jgi:DNA polymerase-3 subunit beta